MEPSMIAVEMLLEGEEGYRRDADGRHVPHSPAYAKAGGAKPS